VQWKVYVGDILSFFMYFQIISSLAYQLSIRSVSPHYDDGLHTDCQPSQSFHRVRGALKFAAKVAMSVRHSCAAMMRFDGTV
jgi:hypothetical protein